MEEPMGLKDILVCLDSTEPGERRLALAAELARLHRAHLTGLYVVEPLQLTGYFSPAISGYVDVAAMETLDTRHRELARARAAEIELRFNEACRLADVTGEWRLVEGDAAYLGVQHGRHADLVVVGQIDPENPPPTGAARLPDQVALASGRPALVVPYAGRFGTIGTRVLVAWNRSRESARALNDALSLLQRAESVTVLTVNPEQGDGAGDLPGADIALHLARHGVKAEASYTVAEDIDVGSVLLSRAADLGVDLLVMGCYGHSRMRELILGGATREILRHMTVPVLMSH
jgi:nucleotide-binding universal stress UspA family protein